MTKNASLDRLLAAVKAVKPTRDEDEQQRRSFAYGNTKIENDRISREIVDEAAKKVEAEGYRRWTRVIRDATGDRV